MPPFMMGIHINKGATPYPTIGIKSQRLWDSQTTWADLNTCDPTTAANVSTHPAADPLNACYNWSNLDAAISDAITGGAVDLLWTVAKVPTWVSSSPADTCNGNAAGSCDPPSDVNADGTGPDAAFKNFMTAAMAHRATLTNGNKIVAVELWNEPHNWFFWNKTGDGHSGTATYVQLARMEADAAALIKAADPSVTVLVSAGLASTTSRNGANSLYTALEAITGAPVNFDALGVHRYDQPPTGCTDTSGYPDLSGVINDANSVAVFQALVAGHSGFAGKPIWHTEGSYYATTNCSLWQADLVAQRAYLGQYFVVWASEGVKRNYWYAWDINAKLWQAASNPANPVLSTTGWTADAAGFINPAGMAWNVVQSWLTGTSFTNSPHGCSASSNLWTCPVTLSTGKAALIAWYDSWGNSSSYTPGSGYNGGLLHKLDGSTQALTNTTALSVTPEPVLLEVGPAGPTVSLSVPSLNFGSQPVGMASAAQYVTVTNGGNSNLTFTAPVSVTGDFALAGGTCSTATPLTPGNSCTLGVQFTPSAAGTRGGAMTLQDNAPDDPQSVALTGTGSSAYTLTVTTSGAGSGTETSSPSGLNCPTTCVASFASGSIDVTANPSSGSTFNQVGGWTGCDSNPSQYVCHISSLTANRTIVATYGVASSGQFTQASRPPANYYPYPTASSAWTQRIPTDATAHDLNPAAYGLTGTYSQMVNCAVTGCGYGAGVGTANGGPMGVQINSATNGGQPATNDQGHPVYFCGASDNCPIYHVTYKSSDSECYYQGAYGQTIKPNFYFHAPSAAPFSAQGTGSDSFLNAYDQVFGLWVSFESGEAAGWRHLPACSGTTIATACEIDASGGVTPSICNSSRPGVDSDTTVAERTVTIAGTSMNIGGAGDNIGIAPPGSVGYESFEELMGGINHAMQGNLLCVNQGGFIYPAVSGALLCNDPNIGNYGGPPANATSWPPAGALLYLALSDAQIAALQLPPLQNNVITALAHYGVYESVTGGTNSTSPVGGDTVDSEQSYCFQLPAACTSLSNHHPIFNWLEGQALGSPLCTGVSGAHDTHDCPVQTSMTGGNFASPLSQYRFNWSMLYGVPYISGQPITSYFHIADPCIVAGMVKNAGGSPPITPCY